MIVDPKLKLQCEGLLVAFLNKCRTLLLVLGHRKPERVSIRHHAPGMKAIAILDFDRTHGTSFRKLVFEKPSTLRGSIYRCHPQARAVHIDSLHVKGLTHKRD